MAESTGTDRANRAGEQSTADDRAAPEPDGGAEPVSGAGAVVEEQEPVGATERSLLRRRPLASGLGGLFWGWLLARWLNDWLGGSLVPAGEPFLDPGPFAAMAAALSAAAESLGPLGWPAAKLAGVLDTVAFAVPYLPDLAAGLWLTLVLTVSGIAFGFVLAVPLSVARVYGRWTAALSLAYTELVRGTPLLAQLFVLYYGFGLSSFVRELPGVGQGVVPDQAVWVAIIGFIVNSAAYQAEYVRGAVESVDPGQLLAARAVGLSRLDGIRFVVLPQALRYAIPGWTNELVYLIKYSSLAAFITVPELFERAQAIASTNFRYTTMFAIAGVLYLAVVLSASGLMGWVEARVAIPGLGGGTRR